MYDRWLTDFYLLISVFLCSIFLSKIELALRFRWNQLPSFFVLFLVSFDGFILIHSSSFVNTNFVFSCYFSVLFLHQIKYISFYRIPSAFCLSIQLLRLPPCHLTALSFSKAPIWEQQPLFCQSFFHHFLFLANSPIFRYNQPIGISLCQILIYSYAGIFISYLSCDSFVQSVRWFPYAAQKQPYKNEFIPPTSGQL